MADLIQYLSSLPEIIKTVITICVFAVVFFIRSVIIKKRKSKGAESGAGESHASSPEEAKGSVTLVDTDEETAAVIMAIVSEKLGIPLEKLDFKSIKRISEPLLLEGVSDEEAAVIMAVTSYQTKKPIEKLQFNHIKLVS